MEFINPEQPPKPCDYFDMIGGTSTGGLIAIMLGRLEMSVEECMTEYQQISSSVFTKVRHRLNWRGEVQGRFDHEVLAEKVREILVKKGFGEELLKDPPLSDSSCRTYEPTQCFVQARLSGIFSFVCATSKETSDTAVLSSCFSKRRGTGLLNRVKIWEAARATSAATSFFSPINIGTEGFVDGAIGANNPINELWNEAYDVWNGGTDWKLEDNIRCMASIGTGIHTLRAFRDSPISVAKALVNIALDTEKVAETFQRHHATLFQENRAFRFNVIRGLEDIGLEEASKQGHILAVTRRYLQSQDVFSQLEKCSEAMQGKQNCVYS
jgi:predicted acylesterase/phospholipase RssA